MVSQRSRLSRESTIRVAECCGMFAHSLGEDVFGVVGAIKR